MPSKVMFAAPSSLSAENEAGFPGSAEVIVTSDENWSFSVTLP